MSGAFRLQFSTGENVLVGGDGLIGRDPRPEPGELVALLVPLSDPARTVSKTHLGFGVDAGRFWVNDRFSANGTWIVAAGGERRRCEPGRRCPVDRGDRVEIGGQSFSVS